MPDTFVRDHTAGAALAAQFGAGTGTAEQLIDANSLRFSQELVAASSLNRNYEAEKDLDLGLVADTAGVERKKILDVAVRGGYVVYVAEDELGRTFKGVLGYEDGELESIDPADDPRRERLQAAARAASQVQEAQTEAEKIVAEAKAEAAKIVAEAAKDADDKAGRDIDAAQKAAAAKAEAGAQGGSSAETEATVDAKAGPEGAASSQARTSGRKPTSK